MRLLFFGTPDWSVPPLEALSRSHHELTGIVTAPDRPLGRSKKLRACPVKQAAIRLGIPRILQPATLRPAEIRQDILEQDADAFVVVAYGRILPGRLLDAPRFGAVNVHFSLLPRHRGASPVQQAILEGDTTTGVSTMRMERGLDTGPILLTRETRIGSNESAPELGLRLAHESSSLLIETLDQLECGELVPRAQDEAKASWAPILTREMGWVDWSLPARHISRQIRAFAGWPKLSARAGKGLFQLVSALPAEGEETSPAEPGTLLRSRGDEIDVACGSGSVLRVSRVKPAGKREMTAAAALAGRFFFLGERLSSPGADNP